MKKKSKKELYELLGAKKFKKIVLKVEKVKWKIIKKLLPNYLKGMEKQFKIQRDKKLRTAKTEAERKRIINEYKSNIILMRKEYNEEQNINYHLDIINPDRIKEYLMSNKSIHLNWLKLDAIITPILLSLLAIGNTWTIPIIVIVALEAIKNFECINLQNYSIACYEEKQEKLNKLSNRLVKKKRKQFGEAQDVITKVVAESDKVPSLEEVIEEARTPESLEQLKQLLLKEKRNREKMKKEKAKNKVMIKGGIV